MSSSDFHYLSLDGTKASFNAFEKICGKSQVEPCIYKILSGEVRVLLGIGKELHTAYKASSGDWIGFGDVICEDSPEVCIATVETEVERYTSQEILSALSVYTKGYTPTWLSQATPPELYIVIESFLRQELGSSLSQEAARIYSASCARGLVEEKSGDMKTTIYCTIPIGENSDWFTAEQCSSSNEVFRSIDINIDYLSLIANELKLDSLTPTDIKTLIEKRTCANKLIKKQCHENKAEPSDEAQLGEWLLNKIGNQLDIKIPKDLKARICQELKQSESHLNLDTLEYILYTIGLSPTKAQILPIEWSRIRLPAALELDNEIGIATKRSANSIRVEFYSEIRNITEDDLEPNQSVSILCIENGEFSTKEKLGMSWIIPVLKESKNVLVLVLISSFFIQLLGLAGPLLVQVVIDKAISQRSMDTLHIIGTALLVIAVIEGILTILRAYLFSETTNRIDFKLGNAVVDHLFRLPLTYFSTRYAGELSSRFQETEKIRNFITNQALTTILDGLFSITYILVMLLYSIKLTIVALSVLPLQIILTIGGAPLLRKAYRESARSNAKAQSHMIEGISGIHTIKSQNIESYFRSKWSSLYNLYLKRVFKTNLIGITLDQFSGSLQKISQLLVLWIGAAAVLDGDLTLGQLIAFRIIAGYVTQPILRLSNAWQSVQEISVSVERLADIVDARRENDQTEQNKPPIHEIQGKLEFRDVGFHFRNKPDNKILKGVSFEVNPSHFVAIVGKSGSGKSTLVRLISRMYSNTEGRILVDGADIQKIEVYSLRRQIGIVPQDSLLFNGTILDNIRLASPDASLEDVYQASTTACCHDFIMSLPDGYATTLTEGGKSLSGGQRQRIAIARALIKKPRLLIFDEATSALDYLTEKQICSNLLKSSPKVTTLFVTHRLNSIKDADHIVVLNNGRIAESGTHKQLLDNRQIYYALASNTDPDDATSSSDNILL